ncbi:MAG TPA: hypothetical protein VM287_11585, partial [Egibacteraceae bacterium]|nr:hypothetical protein [Egibacteraceae bacterium]
VVGDHLVGALFQTGEFGAGATVQVWAILAGYSLGLLASTGSRLLQSASRRCPAERGGPARGSTWRWPGACAFRRPPGSCERCCAGC